MISSAQIQSLSDTEGVTPGPWEAQKPGRFPCVDVRAPKALNGENIEAQPLITCHVPGAGNNVGPRGLPEAWANARHVAACDPQTIASLCAEILSSRALLAEVREVLEPFDRLGKIILAESPPDAKTIVLFTSATGERFSVKLDYFRSANALLAKLQSAGVAE